MYYRQKVVDIIESWIGKNVADGSYKSIIDCYNDIKPLPVGYKLQYDDAWCAGTYSACFHEAGYDSICPSECSCNRMVNKAKEMGIWVENDAYVPNIGDAVLYDWEDNGVGDNAGFPDHVGMVTRVDGNKIYVVEGNVNNSVVERVIGVNSQYIRGFVTPKFDATKEEAPTPTEAPSKSVNDVAKEVIQGKWGSGSERKRRLIQAGYDYDEVQKAVNSILGGNTVAPSPSKPVTNASAPTKKLENATKFDNALSRDYTCTDNLNLRVGAGTNKDIIVTMPKGNKVRCFGYYTPVGSTKWLCVNSVVNGVTYTGYCSSDYLR